MAASTSAARLGQALKERLRGAVIDRDHPDYHEARRVWNGLIDRYPAVIARCADREDVVAAVGVAREHRPQLSVRGGGHQIAGSAVIDDGLVIDLSAMKEVVVDPAAKTVRAQGGVTWGELDRATQRFGLATPGGEVSTTGIAGFTLGGGMGLIMRAHGLACDALRSIEIVTADGKVLRASATQHPELFWAARGGGRGLGVVTELEFNLVSLGPEVYVAQVFYPFEDAASVFRAWQRSALVFADTVTPQYMLWAVPPDPAIPEELHGRKTAVVIGLYAGQAEQGEEVLAPLRQLGRPLFDLSGILPYTTMQSSVDEVFPAGGRYYMKSHFTDELGDGALGLMLDRYARSPSADALVAIRTMGGAVARVAQRDSAYAHRSAKLNVSIDIGWHDPALDARNIGWARGLWDALRPHATGGVYVNFSGLDDEADELRGAIFGTSLERLAQVRASYDPEGLFAGAALRQ